METQCVPALTGFAMKFLALELRRSDAAALDQVGKADLKREEEPENERGRRNEREPRRCRPPGDATAPGRAPVP